MSVAGLSQRQIDAVRRFWTQSVDRPALVGTYVQGYYALCPEPRLTSPRLGALQRNPSSHRPLSAGRVQPSMPPRAEGAGGGDRARRRVEEESLAALEALIGMTADAKATRGELERFAYAHAHGGGRIDDYQRAGSALMTAFASWLRGRTADEIKASLELIWKAWEDVLVATHAGVDAGEPPPVGALDTATPLQVYLRAATELGLPKPSSAVVDVLTPMTTFADVVEMDMDGRYLGNRGVMALLWVVERAVCLKRFGLRDAHLYSCDATWPPVPSPSPASRSAAGSDGNHTIAAVCQALVKAKSVTEVDFSRNAIASQGARHILHLCESVKGLTEVNLSETLIPESLLRCCGNALMRNRDARRRKLESQRKKRTPCSLPAEPKSEEVVAELARLCRGAALCSGHGDRQDASLVMSLSARPAVPFGEQIVLGHGEAGLLVSGELSCGSGAEQQLVRAGALFGMFPIVKDRMRIDSDSAQLLSPVSRGREIGSPLSDASDVRLERPPWTSTGSTTAEWWAVPRAACVNVLTAAGRFALAAQAELLRFVDADGLSAANAEHLVCMFTRHRLAEEDATIPEQALEHAVVLVQEGEVTVTDAHGVRRRVCRGEAFCTKSAAELLSVDGCASYDAFAPPAAILVADARATASVPAVHEALRRTVLRSAVTTAAP